MAFEDMENDENEEEFEEEAPPEESGNRAFFIIAALISLIALALLGCIVIYVLTRGDRPVSEEAAARQTQNARMALAFTQTFEALMAPTFTPTPTRTNTPLPNTATSTVTPLPTRTAVVAVPSDTPPPGTGTGTGQDSLTATVAALQTRAAQITQTVVVPTATSLPQTGFAEDIGLPTLLGAALLLAVVIVLARRLRTA